MTRPGTAERVAGHGTSERGSELVLAGISKWFGRALAVDSVDLTVARREFVTVLGPSGCGKTTLLRMIGGFIEPDDGQIIIDGSDVRKVPVERRPTAMLFQGYSLWPHLSVARNIGFGLELRHWRRREIAARVAELLELVGLEGFGDRLPHELSGGQQQRVALVRALALDPRILLLDEPFSSLDLKLRLELRNAVRAIQRRVGTTTILVTHDQDEALELSDRVVVMSKGHIEQTGEPTEVYERPRTRFVAQFIGSMNFLDGTLGPQGVTVGPSTRVPVTDEQLPVGHGSQSIGVRPEDVMIEGAGAGGAPADVESVTLRGHYKELVLRLGTVSLRAYAPKESVLQAGDSVSCRFRRVHQFPREPVTGLLGAARSGDGAGEGDLLDLAATSGEKLPGGRQ
jgi:putative spermidine/putrescine transport system ATP-binding protein